MANLPDFSYPQTEPFNFCGLDDQDYKSAKVTVFPVPYSSTTYWKSGTKDGPRAIIEASRHLELWDCQLKSDISKMGIYTLPELAVSKNSPKEATQQIEAVITQILRAKKFPLMIGGEHSITLGAVRASTKHFDKLSVLQLDAHTDLRFEFEETKFHHACVMRRISQDLEIPVTQVGIRSVSEEEIAFLKKSKKNFIFFAPELPVAKIIKTLKPNVYVTIDLDVFDPSVMPAVGTPEPGGLGWYEILSLVKSVAARRNIVAADIVELDPIPGISAPDFLAAKLAYKIIGYVLT